MSSDSNRIVITIDGLAASGKSTLSKLLAKELGFHHVNTGLLYRATAYLALKQQLDSISDRPALLRLIRDHNLAFDYTAQLGSRVLLDGSDVTDEIQSQEVATFTSKIAAIPELRAELKDLQVGAFPGCPIVVEGRDTGTVIFPTAAVKFFIEGDPLIRAQRRTRDLMRDLSPAEFDEKVKAVALELKERDARDLAREFAPLKQAADALVIDNTEGELSQTVSFMIKLAKDKIGI